MTEQASDTYDSGAFARITDEALKNDVIREAVRRTLTLIPAVESDKSKTRLAIMEVTRQRNLVASDTEWLALWKRESEANPDGQGTAYRNGSIMDGQDPIAYTNFR